MWKTLEVQRDRIPRAEPGRDCAFNDPKCRKWVLARSERAVNITNALGTKMMVLWLAREGTYIRESTNAIEAHTHLLQALNHVLRYDPAVTMTIEPKPKEPMKYASLSTFGNALAMGKVWSVHLTDHNGLEVDEDETFGGANLRGALKQVGVVQPGACPEMSRFVGLDVKAMRTQKAEVVSSPRFLALGYLQNRRKFTIMSEVHRGEAPAAPEKKWAGGCWHHPPALGSHATSVR